MSSFAVAQTEEKPPQASKIDEFETATNGYVKWRMDAYFVELDNNPSAQGYVINFGTNREIAIREKQLRTAMTFRRFDTSRITLVNSGFRGIVKTELWLVPPGAENPPAESSSIKQDEFEKLSSGELRARLDAFFNELNNNPDSTGYIVNHGTAKTVLTREKLFKNYITQRKFDPLRVKFLKGGNGKILKTELWIDSTKTKNQ